MAVTVCCHLKAERADCQPTAKLTTIPRAAESARQVTNNEVATATAAAPSSTICQGTTWAWDIFGLWPKKPRARRMRGCLTRAHMDYRQNGVHHIP